MKKSHSERRGVIASTGFANASVVLGFSSRVRTRWKRCNFHSHILVEHRTSTIARILDFGTASFPIHDHSNGTFVAGHTVMASASYRSPFMRERLWHSCLPFSYNGISSLMMPVELSGWPLPWRLMPAWAFVGAGCEAAKANAHCESKKCI